MEKKEYLLEIPGGIQYRLKLSHEAASLLSYLLEEGLINIDAWMTNLSDMELLEFE